jgi:nitrogen fixation-related uncharacterized protein
MKQEYILIETSLLLFWVAITAFFYNLFAEFFYNLFAEDYTILLAYYNMQET